MYPLKEFIGRVRAEPVETNLPVNDQQSWHLNKLYQFSAMQASKKSETDEKNAMVLTRGEMRSNVILLMRLHSKNDQFRKPEEKDPEFWEKNIYMEKNVLLFNPREINFENAVNWLNGENITSFMQGKSKGLNDREMFVENNAKFEEKENDAKFFRRYEHMLKLKGNVDDEEMMMLRAAVEAERKKEALDMRGRYLGYERERSRA